MDTKGLLDNFETIAEAKGSVARLRELILRLAIQGKLVPQDPNDEPSSVPLKHAAISRASSPVKKKRTKAKTGVHVDATDMGFPLPEGWAAQQLGALATTITKGATPTTYGFQYQTEGVNFIKIENVKNGYIHHDSVDCFISAEADQAQARSQLAEGDILFSIAGTIGKTCIVRKHDLPANTNQALAIIRGTPLDPRFTKLQLDSFVANEVRDRARGGAMNNVSLGDLRALFVVVPPLAEQRRIVSRVDKLMEFCDVLEKRQERRHAVRQDLQTAALEALSAADSPGALSKAWGRVQTNWSALTARPDSVPPLRQAILQLAVQGKLVPTPNRDIRSVALGSVTNLQNGYAFKSRWYSKRGVRLVRNANVGHGILDWSDKVCLPSEKAVEFDRFKLDDGDIVLSLDRPLISTGLKIARVGPSDLPALLLQRVARVSVRDAASLDPRYLFLWLRSPVFTQVINPGRSKGVPHISTKQIAQLQMDLLPPETQRLTVVHTNRLLELCDDLEGHLQTQEETSDRFAAAAVHALVV